MLLGVSPGCGGAILVVLMYVRGRASYGAVIATLTATMGDASFVMIAIDPLLALVVHSALLVAGVLTGYAVDGLRIDPRRSGTVTAATSPAATAATSPAATAATGRALPGRKAPRDGVLARNEAGPPRPAGQRLPLQPGSAAALSMPTTPALLWLAAALGTVLTIPATLQLDGPVTMVPELTPDQAWLLVGVCGTAACIAVYVWSGCRLCDDDDSPPATLGVALTHGAVETAFVTVWVAAVLVLQALLGAWTGMSSSMLPVAGVVGVAVGALVGLLPGCGTQIAFTALYATGALPLPTLLANAVAQDGDALLPLLAHDRPGSDVHELPHDRASAPRRRRRPAHHLTCGGLPCCTSACSPRISWPLSPAP